MTDADIIAEIDRRIARKLAVSFNRSTGTVRQRNLRADHAQGAVRELRSLRTFITKGTA